MSFDIGSTKPVETEKRMAPSAGCSSSTTESVSSSDRLFVDLSVYLAAGFLLLPPRPPTPLASPAGSIADPDGPSSPSVDISAGWHGVSHVWTEDAGSAVDVDVKDAVAGCVIGTQHGDTAGRHWQC